MKLLLLFALAVSVAGCKKKEAEHTVAPTPAGSGSAAATMTPADAPSMANDTVDAAMGGATDTGSAGSATGSGAGSGEASIADCADWSKFASGCSRDKTDPKVLQSQCENAIRKNNPMASSTRAWIACSKANAECDGYKKCLAGIR